jgi:hypothetical protein
LPAHKRGRNLITGAKVQKFMFEVVVFVHPSPWMLKNRYQSPERASLSLFIGLRIFFPFSAAGQLNFDIPLTFTA